MKYIFKVRDLVFRRTPLGYFAIADKWRDSTLNLMKIHGQEQNDLQVCRN